MLEESRLYSFLDKKNDFVIHFLEADKLISDLLAIHLLNKEAFLYLKKCILTIQPMIAFLKPTEGFGIYIDSEEPYFRFKVETNAQGNMRTLLLPEDFNLMPEKISGKCRLSKIFGGRMKPYTSIVDLDNITMEKIIDKLLNDSYQVQSEVKINSATNQSIMLMKLPNIYASKQENSPDSPSLKDFWTNHGEALLKVMDKGLTAAPEIKAAFEALNLELLGSKPIQFKCSCSKERILVGLIGMQSMTPEELFQDDKTLTVKCDYCKENYIFELDEVVSASKKH